MRLGLLLDYYLTTTPWVLLGHDFRYALLGPHEAARRVVGRSIVHDYVREHAPEVMLDNCLLVV